MSKKDGQIKDGQKDGQIKDGQKRRTNKRRTKKDGQKKTDKKRRTKIKTGQKTEKTESGDFGVKSVPLRPAVQDSLRNP